MAKTDFTISAFSITTTSATGAFHNLGGYIDEFSGLEILAEIQETHGMGDAWAEQTFAGLRRVSPVTISGFYDDVAASGPVAILGNATDVGAERVIKVNFGTTNAYPKVDVIVQRFAKMPKRGELTRWEAELLPTGAVTVVTT